MSKNSQKLNRFRRNFPDHCDRQTEKRRPRSMHITSMHITPTHLSSIHLTSTSHPSTSHAPHRCELLERSPNRAATTSDNAAVLVLVLVRDTSRDAGSAANVTAEGYQALTARSRVLRAQNVPMFLQHTAQFVPTTQPEIQPETQAAAQMI